MNKNHFLSIAALLGLTLPLFSQSGGNFGGPSILSRGMRPIGPGDSEPIRFRGFAAVRGGFSGSLSPLATDLTGAALTDSSMFASLGFGVYGSRNGTRDAVVGGYSGFYSLYNNRFHSGLSQQMMLGYSRQITQRWGLFAGAAGTSQNTVLGPVNSVPLSSLIDNPFDTTVEAFDGRVIGLAGYTGASYRPTNRLSFSMSGMTATQRRNSRSLASGEVYSANGEVNYALGRRLSVGGSYSFSKYLYAGNFGDATGMTWMGMVRRQLDRTWSIGGGVGLFRMEAIRVISFAVDPQIAALTGIRREIGRFYDNKSSIAAMASLNGNFRRKSINLNFNRGQTPGNGISLAGLNERFSATASMTAAQRLSTYGGFLWSRYLPVLSGVAGTATYQSYGPMVGLNYHLFSIVHASCSAQLRKQILDTPRPFNPGRYVVTFGLTFSPGELPLQVF